MKPRAPLAPAGAKRFYDGFGAKQDWQSFYEDEAVSTLVAHSRFDEARAVFELGCGTGRLAERLLRENMTEDARYVGVDISDTMVTLATERLVRFGSRVQIERRDATAGVADLGEDFDRFVSTYVLDLMSDEHIDAMFEQAENMLVPGGLLCLASLTHGKDRWSRFVERQWMRAWSLSPRLMGGCRPITIVDRLSSAWHVSFHDVVSAFGLCSEIVVATKVA